MNNKKRILMIVANQFGYHIDAYYYCLYKPDDFDITYIDKSRNQQTITLDSIRIITIPFFKRPLGKVYANVLFIVKSLFQIWFGHYDLIFVKYFKACSLLRISAFWKDFILDIRTGSVESAPNQRKKEDNITHFESLFFKHITIISEGLSDKLRIAGKKKHLLPLGAEPLHDIPPRPFDSLRLLYVGTFYERNLDRTIDGLRLFMQRHPDVPVQYSIIGNGNEMKNLQLMISDPIFNGCIRMPGYIPHEQLKKYWKECNVGVSFVPITDQFDVQPPTKTFEYIAAGMPCIATETQQNALVINPENGVLCRDTAPSFCEALETVWACREMYNSEKIINTLGKYNWKDICCDLYHHMRIILNIPESNPSSAG